MEVFSQLWALIEGTSIGGFSIVFILSAAMVCFFLVRFLKKILVNILLGGALYVLLDAFAIMSMSWSVTDGILVALFGLPGTILIVLMKLFL